MICDWNLMIQVSKYFITMNWLIEGWVIRHNVHSVTRTWLWESSDCVKMASDKRATAAPRRGRIALLLQIHVISGCLPRCLQKHEHNRQVSLASIKWVGTYYYTYSCNWTKKDLYYYLYCNEGKVPIPTLCVVFNTYIIHLNFKSN